MIRRLAAILLLLGTVLLLPGGLAWAQDDEQSREERLRQHEERVRQIIERRRQERLQGREDTVVEQPAITGDDTTQSPLSLGNALLYVAFRIPDRENEVQLDTVVRAGTRFVSEIRLHNSAAVPFDRVRIALRFDKRFIRPVKVFDSAIRADLKGAPRFEINERDSMLLYDATLARPRITKELPVLKIVWEAIRPTEYTGLQFAFASGDTEAAPHTAIYDGQANILGNPDDPIDGVLGGSILVLKPFDPNSSAAPEILQGKKEELREIYLGTIGSRAQVGLRLVGPETPPAVGEEFHVEVHLNNPAGAVIDSVRFFVRFDPHSLEVLDDDRGNWIRQGINVHDGLYRRDFPFDFHKRNEVDNRRGYINYAMALSDGMSLPTGPFARIRFRVLRPVAETEIEIVAGQPGLVNRSAVQYFGFDLLSANPALTTPMFRTALLPEPLEGAFAGLPGTEGSPVRLPSVLSIPALFPSLANTEPIPPRP
jgi:hypothetical protein